MIEPHVAEKSSTFKKAELIMLITLATAQFTHNVDFMLLMPLSSQLMAEFGVGASKYALLVSVYTFSAAISGIGSAFFIDRFERKRALLVVYGGLLIATTLCALSNSYMLLLAARIVAGAFGGVLGALILAVISDAIPLSRRARAISMNTAAFSAAAALGIPFSLYLATLHTWNTPFYVLSGLGVVIMVGIIRFVPTMDGHLDTKKAPGPAFATVVKMLRNKNRLIALAFISLLVMGQFTVIPFIAPYLTLNVGFDGTELTLMYLIGGLATVFSAPLIGSLADRMGKQKVFRIVALFSVIPMLGITLTEAVPNFVLVYVVSTLFFILVRGRLIPATTLVTATVESRQRGSFMSVVSSVRQLSNAIASLIGGLIIVQVGATSPILGYHWVGLLAVAFTLLAMLVSFRLKVTNTQ